LRKLPAILAEMVAGGVSPAALFHETIETAFVGMLMLDLKGRIQYANTAYCEMSGYPAASLQKREFISLEESELQPELRAKLAGLLRGEQESVRMDGRQIRRDGSILWVHMSASLLRDAKQKPHAVMVVIEDVTPQHNAEYSLVEIEAEKLQVLEAVPEMVWVTGPEGEPEFVNAHWREFTGTDPTSEPFGGAELIHPEDRDRTMATFADALRTKMPYQMEHRMRHEDGSYRWVMTRAQPLMDVDGHVARWFGASTDIHERKETEALLRRTEQLAAAGRLAATIAHEINNPLEAVSNLLYLAQHEQGVPPASQSYLRTANEELRRVGHIVSQTLSFYRESGALRFVDLRELVDDVLLLYQRKLDARQIRVTRSLENVMVEGAPGELRQVLANLMSNALDAMEPYGVLGIELRAERGEAVLSISDTGHGIAKSLLGRIFEPFFTTKKEAGTGLGLWVSKGIVEKHHGRLEVVSSEQREDHGTAFVMTLPRQEVLRRSA
jgi:PAS domain S-box-containing protein